MNEMQVFQNEEFGKIKAIEIDGTPWLVGKDVAVSLGYSNPQKAIRDHVDQEDRTVNEAFTVNGTPPTLINESGLYSLTFSSKLPKAKEFKRWVTSEVLPTIRKTGGYGQLDVTAIIMQTATAVCAEMVKQLTPLFQQMAQTPAPTAFGEYMVLEDIPESKPRRRKKPASIIDRLCPELRREVEEMLCDGRHTYFEVCSRLRQEGISISVSLCPKVRHGMTNYHKRDC